MQIIKEKLEIEDILKDFMNAPKRVIKDISNIQEYL